MYLCVKQDSQRLLSFPKGEATSMTSTYDMKTLPLFFANLLCKYLAANKISFFMVFQAFYTRQDTKRSLN